MNDNGNENELQIERIKKQARTLVGSLFIKDPNEVLAAIGVASVTIVMTTTDPDHAWATIKNGVERTLESLRAKPS